MPPTPLFPVIRPLHPPFWLRVTATAEGRVVAADFLSAVVPPEQPRGAAQPAALTELAAWLDRWLSDPHLDPWPAVQPSGTPFQQRVWQHLRAIPCGETRTYGEVAKHLATSPRAVGAACRSNPCPIFIPCHRIVGPHQALVGFSGSQQRDWLALKAWLLAREQRATA